jgi:hypothetical protein
MAISIGDQLMGLGAAVQGRGPEYVQGLQQREQQGNDRKRQEFDYRQKAMLQDGYQAFQMLSNGDLDGIISLGRDRMEVLSTFPGADPSDTARVIQNATNAKAGDPVALNELTKELTSTAHRAVAMGIITPQKPEEFTLSPGQTRFRGGNQVASVPAEAEKTPDSIRALQFRAEQLHTPGSPEYQQFMARGGVEPEVSPQDVFGESGKLRTEFSGIPAVKDFSLQAQAMGRIVASASNPSAAGDLALIFNYMKVLDPGSTVREGEFANAQNAGSIPARIAALYNNVTEGQRLTEAQRSDFVSRATGLYNSAEQGYNQLYTQYEDIANRRGLPVKDSMLDYRYQFAAPLPQYFNSKVEADAAGLKPGDEYEIPDPDDDTKILTFRKT